MKVLHIFNELKYSGAELMYAKAAPSFQEKGIDLYALSTANNMGEFNKVFNEADIKTFHFPFPEGKFAIHKKYKFYLNFYQFLKEKQIDLLHIHRSDIYTLGLIARFADIPIVKTMHNVFKNRIFTRPYAVYKRWIGRNLYGITFHSIGQSVFENEKLYYKNPSVRINNWFDNSKFQPASIKERNEIIKRLGLNIETFKIISVGGCSNIKNHHDIIKSLALLPKDLKIEYFHLGTGHTEDEEKKLASNLKVNQMIHFLGNKDNVRDYLIASDVFIMPSIHEGLGNSCLEAMACGIPTILYNVPGLKDLILENDCGFLIEKDVDQLAHKIIEYYRNPELKITKGKAGSKFAKQHFSLEHNVGEMIYLYKSLSL